MIAELELEIDEETPKKGTTNLSKKSDKEGNKILSFIILCVCCFFQNLIITGSATVVLSTLEKEFFLTSSESGFFLGIFEIAAFISSPIFGFFGSLQKIKKLKLISFSLFLIASGSYLIGFVVFFKEPYLDFISNELNQTQNQNLNLCPNLQYVNDSISKIIFKTETEDNFGCDSITKGFIDSLRHTSRNQSILKYEIFLYFGHFLIGLGSVAIYTIGVAYIEEIANLDQSPAWQAILYGVGSIGGGIGFLATGQFLNINARFYSNSYAPNNWIKPDNSYWIGAWWLPYLSYGTICAFLFLFVYLFSFISFNKKYSVNQETAHNNETLKSFSINFIKNIKESFKNGKLMFVTFSMITEGIILKGFLGFMSKYVEYQFQMKASDATLALGLVALISVICGTLASARIIQKYKLGAKECALMSLIIFFFTSFCFLILLNYCPEMKFIDDIDEFKCPECYCTNSFYPVCLTQNSNITTKEFPNVYQSPCHAGCTVSLENNRFFDCKCMKNTLGLDIVLSADNCSKGIKCFRNFIINGIAAFLIVLFTAMSVIPHLKSLLGCVDEVHQSLALGVRSSFVGLFGNFLGTLVVGQSVDLTCKYWQHNCFKQKVCKMYDNYSMSLALAIIGFGCRFLSAIFMIFPTYKFYVESKFCKKDKTISQIELVDIQI